MIDRYAKLNMSKVTRAGEISTSAGRARRSCCLRRTHSGVIKTIGKRVAQAVKGLMRSYFADTSRSHISIGVETIDQRETETLERKEEERCIVCHYLFFSRLTRIQPCLSAFERCNPWDLLESWLQANCWEKSIVNSLWWYHFVVECPSCRFVGSMDVAEEKRKADWWDGWGFGSLWMDAKSKSKKPDRQQKDEGWKDRFRLGHELRSKSIYLGYVRRTKVLYCMCVPMQKKGFKISKGNILNSEFLSSFPTPTTTKLKTKLKQTIPRLFYGGGNPSFLLPCWMHGLEHHVRLLPVQCKRRRLLLG